MLLNQLLSEMGLFTLHICLVSCLLDYLKHNLSLKVDFIFQSILVSTVGCVTFKQIRTSLPQKSQIFDKI